MNNDRLIFFVNKINDKGKIEYLYITDCIYDLLYEIRCSTSNKNSVNIYYKNSSIQYHDNGIDYYIYIHERPVVLRKSLFRVDTDIRLKFNHNVFNLIQNTFTDIEESFINDNDINFLFKTDNTKNFIENILNSNIYNGEQINLIYSSINKDNYVVELSNACYSKEEFCSIMNIDPVDVIVMDENKVWIPNY